jgi:GntR family transcriptional regulator
MRFFIDPKSGVPFYRQVIDQVKFAIGNGELSTGDQLPTVRQLAVDLKVNPNTVARAYQELEIRGVVTTHLGSGTFVADTQIEISEVERQRMLDQICTELLSRTSSYGFTVMEVLRALQERVQEDSGGT